jgi:hypothetical protein
MGLFSFLGETLVEAGLLLGTHKVVKVCKACGYEADDLNDAYLHLKVFPSHKQK